MQAAICWRGVCWHGPACALPFEYDFKGFCGGQGGEAGLWASASLTAAVVCPSQGFLSGQGPVQSVLFVAVRKCLFKVFMEVLMQGALL